MKKTLLILSVLTSLILLMGCSDLNSSTFTVKETLKDGGPKRWYIIQSAPKEYKEHSQIILSRALTLRSQTFWNDVADGMNKRVKSGLFPPKSGVKR